MRIEAPLARSPVEPEATPCGGVAEWLKAAVLKTVKPQGFVGSNPTASARNATRPAANGSGRFLRADKPDDDTESPFANERFT